MNTQEVVTLSMPIGFTSIALWVAKRWISKIDDKNNEQDKNTKDLESKMDKKIEHLEKSFDSSLKEMEAEFETLIEEAIETNAVAMENHKSQVALALRQSHDDLNTAKVEVTKVRERLASIETLLTEHEKRSDKIDSHIEAKAKDIAVIKDNMVRIVNSFAKVWAHVDACKKKLDLNLEFDYGDPEKHLKDLKT